MMIIMNFIYLVLLKEFMINNNIFINYNFFRVNYKIVNIYYILNVKISIYFFTKNMNIKKKKVSIPLFF